LNYGGFLFANLREIIPQLVNNFNFVC